MVMPVVVLLPNVRPKSDIFRYVKNLKGLEKWKRITIADDLTKEELQQKREMQAIVNLAIFWKFDARLKGHAMIFEGV